jgi:diguanylate cyclase
MDRALVALMLASGLAGAAMLWMAAELNALAPGRPPAITRALLAVNVLLATTGMWWPVHTLTIERHAGTHDELWAAATALVIAALSCAAGWRWQRGRPVWLASTLLTLPVVSYVQTMLLAPGLFRLDQAAAWLGAGTLSIALAAAVVVAQWSQRDSRRDRAARIGAAVVAVAIVTFGAAMSMPIGAGARPAFGPDWLILSGLLAMGGLLLGVLRGAAAGEAGAAQQARPRAVAFDALTGLPMRLQFEGELQRAAKRCQQKETRLAVLFIDLDGFKPVNDHFGHSCGDRVLEQVGERLKAIVRKSGLAARIGGDEFLVLATDVASAEAVGQIAKRLIEALSRPYKIDEREVSISCSVGISVFPHKCQPDKLIARADAAMYAAKRAGGARHCFYAPEMDVDVQQNFDTMRDLRAALVRDELELFFQPKIDARSGKVTAAEALVRWNHPTRGLVMPNDFVPLAERSGVIGPLGNWVIEAACKQARAWREKGLRMRVAINLSAHQMRQDDIADRITEALARYRIHPSLLTCEVTESAAMEDTAATQETFRRLGELGVHLSIDDFGTGYSSLAYLRRLPAEELKIDASFVRDIHHSADARAVVDAVVKLAHALGLKVVAEGVESLRQQQILAELGCDELQGYLFAKPMSARALLLWALDDRSSSAMFRDSLFGETRHATRVAPTMPGTLSGS